MDDPDKEGTKNEEIRMPSNECTVKKSRPSGKCGASFHVKISLLFISVSIILSLPLRDEDWVSCDSPLWIMSGPEGSSIKRQVGCAAGLPSLSGVVFVHFEYYQIKIGTIWRMNDRLIVKNDNSRECAPFSAVFFTSEWRTQQTVRWDIPHKQRKL